MGLGSSRGAAFLGAVLALGAAAGCRELEGFSTGAGESYRGTIVAAEDLRQGVALDGGTELLGAGTTAELTLRVEELQTENVGRLTTSDGLLQNAALHPVVHSWNDTLSGLSFPWGRLRSALYVVEPAEAYREAAGPEILVMLSLMVDDSVEIRLIAGANQLYKLFRLTKTQASGDAGGDGAEDKNSE
jgi:hypothetical protein